tara:strand:- start:284 stop:799 length:516 start_codon:yes stop_codon:yes gene_type:complete
MTKKLLETTSSMIKCCRCNRPAVVAVEKNNEKWPVCIDHVPTDEKLVYLTDDATKPELEYDWLRKNGFLTKLSGKDFVLFPGLLALAHKKGLNSIETEIIYHDIETNNCVVRAVAAGDMGIYSGIGDANPANTKKMTAVHYIRMAETRAVARCLRLYTNIGLTSDEEMAST